MCVFFGRDRPNLCLGLDSVTDTCQAEMDNISNIIDEGGIYIIPSLMMDDAVDITFRPPGQGGQGRGGRRYIACYLLVFYGHLLSQQNLLS
jgi:hypothetical protein